ncbi:MAG: lysozyme inhibitor LprI family protein [Agathobacter sp.]|nr:lysozyme inhibitor LprI family protein [Agathobacter sp.]
MKKKYIALALSLMIFTCGCESNSRTNNSQNTENIQNTESQSQVAANTETETMSNTEHDTEYDSQEPSETQTPTTGDGYDIEADIEEIERKEAELVEKSNADGVTQTEMNMYASQIYELWDDELNLIWDMLSDYMGETEFEALKIIQNEWIKERDKQMEEAAEENGGGSLAPMLKATAGAELTKEKVIELAKIITGN